MYDAVNRGLAKAGGEILGYLPSDDLYLPWTVEAVVNAFEADRAFDLDFRRRRHGRGEHVNAIQQPAVFWRRSVSHALGTVHDRMRYVAGHDFWLRAAAAGTTIRPWHRFLTEGGVTVRPRPLLSGLRPRRHYQLRTAMHSRLVAERITPHT